MVWTLSLSSSPPFIFFCSTLASRNPLINLSGSSTSFCSRHKEDEHVVMYSSHRTDMLNISVA